MEQKDILKFTLLEEIARIESHVSALRAPINSQERSLIARYGKLLLVSHRLMEEFFRVSTSLREEAATGAAEFQPMPHSQHPGIYEPVTRPGFKGFPPERI